MAGPPRWRISSAHPRRPSDIDLPRAPHTAAHSGRLGSASTQGAPPSTPSASRTPKWLHGKRADKVVSEHRRTQPPGTSRAYLARESTPDALRRLRRLGIEQDVRFDGADAASMPERQVCWPAMATALGPFARFPRSPPVYTWAWLRVFQGRFIGQSLAVRVIISYGTLHSDACQSCRGGTPHRTKQQMRPRPALLTAHATASLPQRPLALWRSELDCSAHLGRRQDGVIRPQGVLLAPAVTAAAKSLQR